MQIELLRLCRTLFERQERGEYDAFPFEVLTSGSSIEESNGINIWWAGAAALIVLADRLKDAGDDCGIDESLAYGLVLRDDLGVLDYEKWQEESKQILLGVLTWARENFPLTHST